MGEVADELRRRANDPGWDVELIEEVWEPLLEVVAAAEGIRFVFAEGPIETVAHRSDFADVAQTLDDLKAKLTQ